MCVCVGGGGGGGGGVVAYTALQMAVLYMKRLKKPSLRFSFF